MADSDKEKTDKGTPRKDYQPDNASEQFLRELEATLQAESAMEKYEEREFSDKDFPLNWSQMNGKEEWSKKDLENFYEDPANRSRTIFSPNMNNDVTDDWGMFGYGPGFIYISGRTYEGSKTLADKAALLGQSLIIDPKTGLGILKHNDYFPKDKYKSVLIRRYEFPRVFDTMCEIFARRKFEAQKGRDRPRLESKP